MLHTVDLTKMTPEIFSVFGSRNALLTAGNRSGCNPMTIGWCQLGRLWNVPVCTVYVRPERYTYQLMEAQNTFSVTVLPEDRADVLRLCGTRSGRDLDKIQACGLTVRYGAEDTPFFEEADWSLICRKLYQQDLEPDGVLDHTVIDPYYGKAGGWHRMYVGQVLEAYSR